MTTLDAADLVVIAGGVLGVSTDTALTQIDMPAAQAALADAALPAAVRAAPASRVAAAAACTRLVHGLLRHPPFPGHSQQVAAAAGLQFLAINGWQADLDPRAAAVVVRGLASGQLTPPSAAGWLLPRLSPLAAAGPVDALRRSLRSALAPHGAGGAGGAGGRMLARFSDDAVVVIFLAQDAARRLGHDHLEPEHFLLGLIRQRDSVAVRALHRLGVDLETLRHQVEADVGPGAGIADECLRPIRSIRPSRSRGQKVLNSALPEALAGGSTEMDTGHMLLAQFHDDGPAVQALARMGAGESQVRAAVAAVLAEAGADHRRRDRKSA